MAKKRTRKVENPFIYEGYESPDYFCDRIEDSEKLISHLRNGRNVTLVSPRKIGKAGLIKHVFYQIGHSDTDAICIYTDIFHTQNLHDFVQTLGKAVIQEQLLAKRTAVNKILKFFSMWRPTISIDPITGTPTVSLSIERTQPEHTLETIFSYLRDCGKEVFIAIDEFQTICDYPEKGTEALLRSYIQFIHNIHFIFSGSKQHLMYEMFGSPKRPFYQSTAIMSLDPLHEDIYYDFAAHFFSNKGGSLSEQVFHSLYQRFSGHTWYMQSVLNRLYERERNVTEEQQVKDAIQVILADKTDQYSMLMTFLSDNQRRLLKALATEGVVVQPLSNAFIQKYELPSSSSVKKALTVLVDKDLVYHATEGYVVYDRFFDLWLRRL